MNFELETLHCADEHIGAEVVLPSQFGHDAYVLARGWVSATEAIEHVGLVDFVVVVNAECLELVEDFFLHGLVHAAPVDVLLALGASSLYNPLILWGATRELASVDTESITILGSDELSFFVVGFMFSNGIVALRMQGSEKLSTPDKHERTRQHLPNCNGGSEPC